MALYTVHNILFSITKLTNSHLILGELLRLVWFPKANQEVIYLVLLITFLLNFIVTIKICNTYGHHEEILKKFIQRSVLWCFGFHISFIYLMNMLYNTDMTEMSIFLKTSHSLICIIQLIGINCTHSCVQSFLDPHMMNRTRKKSNDGDMSWQVEIYMKLGSFSLAFAAVTQFEIVPLIGSKLCFTNSGITISATALLIELLVLRQLMSNIKHENQPVESDFNETFNETHFRHKVTDLSPNLLTISVADFSCTTGREVLQVSDEDELTTPSEVFHTKMLNPGRLDENAQDAESYDRSKFSLYEGFDLSCTNQGCYNKSGFVFESQYGSIGNGYGIQAGISLKTRSSIMTNRSFIKDSILMTIIGCTYQANQLLLLPEYLRTFIHGKFKIELISSLDTLSSPLTGCTSVSMESFPILAQLISVCLFAQYLARALTLHYIKTVVSKLGKQFVLIMTMMLGIFVMLNAALSYYMVRYGCDLSTNRVCIEFDLILAHILFIQVQVGAIWALQDYFINDLTLHHVRGEDTLTIETKSSQKHGPGNEYSYIHSVLNGLAYSISASVAILIRLIIGYIIAQLP